MILTVQTWRNCMRSQWIKRHAAEADPSSHIHRFRMGLQDIYEVVHRKTTVGGSEVRLLKLLRTWPQDLQEGHHRIYTPLEWKWSNAGPHFWNLSLTLIFCRRWWWMGWCSLEDRGCHLHVDKRLGTIQGTVVKPWWSRGFLIVSFLATKEKGWNWKQKKTVRREVDVKSGCFGWSGKNLKV